MYNITLVVLFAEIPPETEGACSDNANEKDIFEVFTPTARKEKFWETTQEVPIVLTISEKYSSNRRESEQGNGLILVNKK